MTTPLQIITRALQTINQLGEGESPTATQANDGLIYFNDLVQSWNNQNLLINEMTFVTLPLTGAASYTIGTGGTLNTIRPIHISSAFYRDAQNNDYSVQMLTREEFDAIPQKGQASTMAYALYVAYTYPLITAYVYPVSSTGSLILNYSKRLQEAATLTTTLALPDGYERALRFALAAEMQPEYGLANPLVMQMAAQSVALLKRTNHRTRKLNAGSPAKYNILTGY